MLMEDGCDPLNILSFQYKDLFSHKIISLLIQFIEENQALNIVDDIQKISNIWDNFIE